MRGFERDMYVPMYVDVFGCVLKKKNRSFQINKPPLNEELRGKK